MQLKKQRLTVALVITGITFPGVALLAQAVALSYPSTLADPATTKNWIIAEATVKSELAKDTLVEGATGVKVKELQQQLKNKGFDPGPIDSTFGAQTKAALIAFQKSKGLRADGVVDPKTSAALGLKLATTPQSSSTVKKLTPAKETQAAKTGPPPKAQPTSAKTASQQRSVIADKYYWSGPEGNLGLSMTGKFTSLEKEAATFNLLEEVGLFKGREWKLGDILVSADFNANGNVATWRVSGPKPLIAKYLDSLRSRYEDKSLLYDFGFSYVDFKPTAASEQGG